MKKEQFTKNKHMFISHLKNNWKIILFFIILFFMYVFIIVIVGSANGGFKLYISPHQHIEQNNNGPQGGIGQKIVSIEGMAKMTNLLIFGPPGMIFISIIMLTFINLILNNELKTGKISFWMTTSLSRSSIIITKLLVLWSITLMVFIPSFIIITILYALAGDAGHYIGWMFLDLLLFTVFMLLLVAIYMCISLYLSESNMLGNIICSLIMVYIFITWVTHILLPLFVKDTKVKDILSQVIKCISVQSLYVESLKFDSIPEFDTSLPSGIYIISAKFIEPNKIWLSFSPLVNLSLISGIGYLTLNKFNKMDFNI